MGPTCYLSLPQKSKRFFGKKIEGRFNLISSKIQETLQLSKRIATWLLVMVLKHTDSLLTIVLSEVLGDSLLTSAGSFSWRLF
jgi:hypothetical protein